MSLILQATVFVLHFSRADGGFGVAGGDAAAAVAVVVVRGVNGSKMMCGT